MKLADTISAARRRLGASSVPVTVVIPAYNAEPFLESAFVSLCEQTKLPAEIIIVDDGSAVPVASLFPPPDDGRWPKIVTLDRNRGPGFARNVGVREVTQPYVAFLDADDLWFPRKLELQYGLMRAWPELDATHTEFVAFFKDGTETQRAREPLALNVATALGNHVMCTASIMIKKPSFDALGGFDTRFRCTQDWELQIRMALAGMRVQLIPDVLVRLRREGHGNHSDNWRCYLAGHVGIVWKHRRSYIKLVGYRGWVRKLTFELYRGGMKRGGLLGSLLELPHRLWISDR